MTPRLPTCSSCEGFVPTKALTCPHCGAMRNAARAVALLVGGAALATLSACYGPSVEARRQMELEKQHPATTDASTQAKKP